VRRPAFLITIDTEGDNIWSSPPEVTTDNARYLPRFQALCEKYGLKPTYLTNYEMAASEAFVEFARDAIGRGRAEVGVHIHAWNSPPMTATGSGRAGMPYLIEFPEQEIVDKVNFMTDLLEDRFGLKMVSHRAGRWAFNETYAKILVARGYRVDCSVTPHVSWRGTKGFADGPGGTDYRRFPAEPYFLDLENIGQPGRSPLLEVPMTIAPVGSPLGKLARHLSQAAPRTFRKAINRAFPAVSWFRPNGRNLGAMRTLLRDRRKSSYIEFMLHSSELMPGGSPAFQTERSIERLYEHLEQVFAEASADYRGLTMSEFRDEFAEG
jgi:hypothetical protein